MKTKVHESHDYMYYMYWYCLTYFGSNIKTGKDCYGSAYVGYNYNKNFSKKDIEDIKQQANVSANSVLISITHLGLMTEQEFKY